MNNLTKPALATGAAVCLMGGAAAGPLTAVASAHAHAHAAAAGTFTGKSYPTKYGPVVVRIQVSGSKITAVSTPGLHHDPITKFCAPALDQEALKAQNAHVHTISGATYTSKAFSLSLQSALNQAHLA